MKPHDKIAGWLVDDDGNIFTRVSVFTCPNHPHGPPHDVDDEHTAAEWIARCLIDELATEAIKTVAPGVTREHIEQAREDLGMCCAGHRWRDTGDLREVRALEIFMRLNMTGNVFGASSILLDELYRAGDLKGFSVSIPLHVHPGTPLPRSAAAESRARAAGMTRQLWTLFDVCCPFCRAGIDEKCKVASGPSKGRLLATYHVERRVAFMQARAAEPVRPVR